MSTQLPFLRASAGGPSRRVVFARSGAPLVEEIALLRQALEKTLDDDWWKNGKDDDPDDVSHQSGHRHQKHELRVDGRRVLKPSERLVHDEDRDED